MVMSQAELRQAMSQGAIDTLVIAICDMQGRLMGKRLTAEHALHGALDHGTHFCKYLLGTDMEMRTPQGYALMNWETGYGDWLARPDWTTLRVIPWLEKTALVMADPVDEDTGQPIPVAPRAILKRQLERAARAGLHFMAASELEFFLFKDGYGDLHANGYRALDGSLAGYYNEDYNLLQGTRNESTYRKIRNLMVASGIPVESSKGEAAPGQHEINLLFGPALTAADQHTAFKHGTKEICLLEGIAATFMAKPDHGWTGSSGHIHLSAWDAEGRRNLFFEEGATPYGMSDTMRRCLAGMLARVREFSLLLASNVNSYKRYAAESWAPVQVVWSRDNRTAGFRIVGHGQGLRVECRIPGADTNPYLAYAGLIAAALDGLEHGASLPDEFHGNAYAPGDHPRVPGSLREAMRLWHESETARAAFGDAVVEHYHRMAEVEQEAFERTVTDWERARYFEQI